MDFSWIGVGSDISIRESAALLVAFKAIFANAGAAVEAPSLPSEPSEEDRLVVIDSLAGPLVAEDKPLRRTLKHGEQ